MKNPNAARAALDGPWAITPTALRSLQPTLEQLARDPTTPITTAMPYRAALPGEASGGAVALVSLHGPIVNRAGWLTAFGFADPQEFAAAIRHAAADPSISEILISVDSPGGTVAGTYAAAEAVREAAAVKPVTAVADGMMASAAYWIASQATRIVVDPTAIVGSIGVIGTHVDASELAAKQGVKVTYVRSAPGKALGQPYEPLSDAARAEWQHQVDAIHAEFVTAVERGRNRALPPEAANGGTLTGIEAVSAGLADEVGTLHSVLTALTADRRGGNASRAGASAPGRSNTTVDKAALMAALALQEDASDEQILAAIAALQTERDAANTRAAASERATRESLAATLIAAANLPRVSDPNDQTFAERCTAAAQAAGNTAAAREAVEALINERRELIDAGATTPTRKAPPTADLSTGKAAKADTDVLSARAGLGLN